MRLSTGYLIALTAVAGVLIPAQSRAGIESHPYFLALAAAEQCEGRRATILDELRLAQAITRESGERISPQDVRLALDGRRLRPDPTVCDQASYVEALNLYRIVVRPLLQEPILKAPETVG
jgi:hypothetical protein